MQPDDDVKLTSDRCIGNISSYGISFFLYQVLDDGTIVRINKTRYSDVSEDGSSYFGFHSTSFVSNVNSNNENKQDEDAEESSGGEGENGMLTKTVL